MTTMNLVVPCYNEEEVLSETSKRLLALLERLIEAGDVSKESRITFIDDGSRDHSWSIIEALHAQNARCGGIKLSRNRGHQNALLAGLMTAQGDVLVSLDADLQDDIEAIPRMLAEYQSGAEIVFGVRHKRTTDTFFKRVTARNYYKLLRTFGVDNLPGHADFRLMSRKTVEALRQFQEVNRFLRGIIPLLGFKTAIVEYERAPRFAGESKYPLSKMLVLAFDGITSFSAVPLQWSTRIGALLAIGSLGFGARAAYVRIFTNLTVPGWASTVIPMYFLGGIQLLFLGVIGGYISKTYAETKQRPRFIIERSGARRASSGSAGGALRGVGVQALIIAGCWIFFADQTIRLHRFAVENAPLDELLSRTEPDQRALSLIFDRASPAYRSPAAYEHQSLWYQTEKHGFVDPNFATYVPQIARFRPGMMPIAPLTLEHDPGGFEWTKDNGRQYRYFFVRKEGPLPNNFFANNECDVTLVTHEGEWSLYERCNCR